VDEGGAVEGVDRAGRRDVAGVHLRGEWSVLVVDGIGGAGDRRNLARLEIAVRGRIGRHVALGVGHLRKMILDVITVLRVGGAGGPRLAHRGQAVEVVVGIGLAGGVRSRGIAARVVGVPDLLQVLVFVVAVLGDALGGAPLALGHLVEMAGVEVLGLAVRNLRARVGIEAFALFERTVAVLRSSAGESHQRFPS
jgi:hypothetical protein